MRYFLVTTEHLENKVWFRDFDDFRTAMNLVAVVSMTLRVNVLAFILMSNHVHFVLECEKWKAEMFTNELKKQYSRYFRLKYGVKELLRGNKNDIQEVSLEQESLERAIAYVLMNCVAANICAAPFSYIWGTGSAYFRGAPAEGKRLDSFSGRRQARLLHSKAKLPGSLLVGKDGFILPESYVKVGFVESLFRTPKRFNYFLNNSSKAKRRLLSTSKLDFLFPEVGHFPVTGRGGVDSVPNPVGRARLGLDQIFEHGVEWHACGIQLRGKLPNYSREAGDHSFAVVIIG